MGGEARIQASPISDLGLFTSAAAWPWPSPALSLSLPICTVGARRWPGWSVTGTKLGKEAPGQTEASLSPSREDWTPWQPARAGLQMLGCGV